MKNQFKVIIIIFIIIIIILSIYIINDKNEEPTTINKNDSTKTNETHNFSYKIINIYPHDTKAFTQGLVILNGTLYEGTGLNGQSSLRKVELETGKIIKIRNLSSDFFGEGVTIFNDRIIQLTWRSNVGFVYNIDTFELIEQFNYSTEGWGFTHNGMNLIMSDGTATLYFLDPKTFEVIDQIDVFDYNGPVVRLNELEYINGEIYANVWQTDRIAIISPSSGRVTGWINLSGLLNNEVANESAGVLNGIAYDADFERLLVTGKFWPKLFEIELVEITD